MSFPATIDNSATLPNPSGVDNTTSPSAAGLNDNQNTAIIALETKLGTGASMAASGKLLRGTGANASAWDKDAPTGTIVGTTDTQVLTNKTLTSPTINTPTIVNPVITVDSISEYTAGNGVTVGGLNIKSGKLNTNNSVVTANITDGSITAAKLSTTGTEIGNILLAWKAYTPTFANLVIGSGTVAGAYMQVGKTITAKFTLTMAADTTVGTSPTVSLPQTSVAADTAAIIGQGLWTGSGSFTLSYIWTSTTTASINAQLASGTYVSLNGLTATIPVAFANGYKISGLLVYEAA